VVPKDGCSHVGYRSEQAGPGGESTCADDSGEPGKGGPGCRGLIQSSRRDFLGAAASSGLDGIGARRRQPQETGAPVGHASAGGIYVQVYITAITLGLVDMYKCMC
jgi:hypothetical protein